MLNKKKLLVEKDENTDNTDNSDDEKTITSQQLKVVDKFIKTCGFRGLMDYETKISAKNITDEKICKLNDLSHKIDKLFPQHEINLRRTNYIFTSSILVMSILRGLLTYIGIRWKSIRTKKSIYIQLISNDITVYDRSTLCHDEYIKKCIDNKPLKIEIHGNECEINKNCEYI